MVEEIIVALATSMRMSSGSTGQQNELEQLVRVIVVAAVVVEPAVAKSIKTSSCIANRAKLY